MTSVLVHEKIVHRFAQDVIAFLRAKGLDAKGDPSQALARFLREPMGGWIYRVKRPLVDRCYLLGSEEESWLFGCSVRFDHRAAQGKRGSRCVRVVSVERSCATVVEDADGVPSNEHEDHEFIVLSGEDMVLLLDTLPGTQFLNIAGIWPSEKVPMELSSSRPGWIGQVDASAVSFLFLEWPRDEPPVRWFATRCEPCSGQGLCNVCRGTAEVTCRACDGDGRRECYRCHGERGATCSKCSGSGRISCPKCKGTGDYYRSPGGSRYDCYPCQGTGYLECRVCGGTGVFTCRECDGSGTTECQACNGTGTRSCPACPDHPRECFLCRGHGVRALSPDSAGGFRLKGSNGEWVDIAPDEVELYDWKRRDHLSQEAAGSAELLRKLRASGGGPPPATTAVRLRDLAAAWMTLECCLKREEELGGSTLQEPLRVGNRQASARREAGYVHYEFDILGPRRDWSQKDALDWKPNTPLRLGTLAEDGEFEELVLSRQAEQSLTSDRGRACFAAFHAADRSPRLTLRFGVAVDPSCLPSEFFLKPCSMRPPQYQLRKHLSLFLQRENWDHPVLWALATAGGLPVALPTVQINDPRLAANKRQTQALRLAVSEAPVCLVKGPPGTGKTTLITEIVRQTVDQGKRVLVCSQTHQAVRNVMEKLEELRYPMYRHVNEDKETELDRRYSWRRIGHEASDIAGRVKEKERRWQATVDSLGLLREACRDGLTAADALRDELARLHAEKDAIERTARDAMETLEADQRNEFNEYERELRDHLADLESKLALQRRRHAKAQRRCGKLETATARLTKVLQSKRPLSERDSQVPACFSRLAIAVGLASWASPVVLRRRIGELQTRVESSTAQASELGESLALLTDTLENRRKLASEWKACHAERWQTKKEDIRSQRESSLSRLAEEEQAALSRLMPTVERARTLARASSFSPPATLIHEEWTGLVENVSDGLAEAMQRLGLVSDWRSDLSTNTEQLSKYLFDDVQVFFSTCVGLASWRELHRDSASSIDLVIIDEAGKATIPETIIPAYYAERLILIGDDMQLPPVRDMGLACRPDSCGASPEVETCWLETSLFERLWKEQGKDIGVMLNTQHRMHRDIADFVSEVFYAGELLTTDDSPNGRIGFAEFSRPVCLVPTMAWGEARHETFEPKTKGYRNVLEAELVKRILQRAEESLDFGSRVSVGVIVPYARQKEHIRECLSGFVKEAQRLEISLEDIDSIDSFQGGERDIIVISFTRSPELKLCRSCGGHGTYKEQKCRDCAGTGKRWQGSKFSFLLDLRRLNVAFSRAKCMLILVGDVDALMDARFSTVNHGGHEVIRRFSDYVQDRGKVLRVWETGVHDD